MNGSGSKNTCNLECFSNSYTVLHAMEEKNNIAETVSASTGALPDSEQNGCNHTEHLLKNDTVDIRFQTVASDNYINPETVSPAAGTSEGDDAAIQLQGLVFLEDAIQYRSIHHRATDHALKLYRWFHSAPIIYSVNVATFLILMLAFFETPSSMSWSSDPRRGYKRVEMPDGFTEGIEVFCLIILLISNIIQCYLTTSRNSQKSFFRQNPWLTGGFIVLLLSFVDVVISLVLGNDVYRYRVRRLFRPYFLAQNTTMLKKTLKAMWNTLPEIASVLTLLSLHLYFFTMFGMLLFPHSHVKNGTATHGDSFNSTEWQEYFRTFDTALISLVVLLTTANNPDVMMPSYSENRFYALYFIIFSLIGTFLVFNLLTAIIYNQFRGYFKSSMQTSYFRRCVALSAAFYSMARINAKKDGPGSTERYVSIDTVKAVTVKANMSPDQRRLILMALTNHFKQNTVNLNYEQFCDLFQNIDAVMLSNWYSQVNVPVWNSQCMVLVQRIVLHRYFNMVGNFVVLLNAILMTVEIAIHYEEAFQGVFSRLNIMNYVFVAYYLCEQVLKILSMGKKYFFNLNCLYDGIISVALIVIELVQLAQYGHSALPPTSSSGISLWDCARIVNILVLLRLLRIIPNFRPMALVTSVMLDIIRSLKSFAGIIIIIYYVFAIIGMMAFEQAITPPAGLPFNSDLTNTTTTPAPDSPVDYACGTYEQLQYWANNFNDFAASLVVLWDVMVVNNWGVFLTAFTQEVSPWSQIYFIAWWLISAVVCINLFVALILDHFIAKWEGNAEESETVRRRTIQSLFRKHLHEPSQHRIIEELNKHPCISCNITET
uniref:Two pore calcium channel protein 2-like n=1 Tax=Phallusia mammillata TaxID=59560 RepID=A0A6F9DVM0_9ASCI|nr:two pore calcium channel protein 2-like [Phallusia mammillata]